MSNAARGSAPQRAVAPLGALLLLALVACPAGPPEAEPTVEAPEAPAEPAPIPPPEAEPAPPADTLGTVPAPAAAERAVRICAGGDVLLGNNLDTLWAARAAARLGRDVPPFADPDSLLAPLHRLLSDADIVLLNVEGAIGEGPAPRKCRPGSTRCYAFRQPVAAAAALRRVAGDAALVANLANNHANDAGHEGFIATMSHLRQAGAHVTGADTLATPIVVPAGDTVAVLGFSPFLAGPDPRDLSALRRHVARAFARYRRVIVSMHVGAEGSGAQRTPNRSEIFLGEDRGNSVAIARAAVESGAALVIGHGPHVLRAAEWRGAALTFYSLGNLLTYGPFNMREPGNIGGIACASIDAAGRVSDAEFRSTYQAPPGLVQFDPAGRGAFLVDSLGKLDFPESAARLLADGTVGR
ncbi:MAG: CapA family protein [Gemmatimonadota bacterium]|nr:MAG: CapA family protein [Gemmatimonadota bacterium]